MIVPFIVLILILLLILNWIRMHNDCRRINLCGPTPLPLIGNAHIFLATSSAGPIKIYGVQMISPARCALANYGRGSVVLKHPEVTFTSISVPVVQCIVAEYLKLITSLQLKYGDAMRFHLFSDPYVILSHPKYIEPVISSMDFITKGRSYNHLTCWLGEGLVTSDGKKWQSHRKFLTPAFHFNILRNFLPVICKNQKIFTEKLRKIADGRLIDIFPLGALAALDNITESVMGVSVEAQRDSESEYVKSVKMASSIIAMKMQIPIVGEDTIFCLLPAKKKLDKALKILHEHTNKVIKARSEELKNCNIDNLIRSTDTGIRNKHAFLDLLLLAECDGKRIDIKNVREEVDTFLFAGHDTTAAAVAYTVFCLSKHRDVQDKIYEELKTIFGDDINRDATFNELQQMKYLELVLKESMRLYPPVPYIERKVGKDTDFGNFKLIKGTTIEINIYGLHRHPELYDKPLEFRPERFETPLTNPFNWISFSAGPRNCIGQKFALMELKVMISEIVKHFIILPSDVEPVLCPELILRSKTGVQVKFMQRM